MGYLSNNLVDSGGDGHCTSQLVDDHYDAVYKDVIEYQSAIRYHEDSSGGTCHRQSGSLAGTAEATCHSNEGHADY